MSALQVTPRSFVFRYRSPEHWLEIFRAYYGPVLKAFQALDADGQACLESDLVELLRGLNRSGDDSLVTPSEYLEVIAARAV